MKKYLSLFGLFLLYTCHPVEESAVKVAALSNYEHPISFTPKSYVCYQTGTPLRIDGIAEETAWQKASWSSSFVDIEGELKPQPFLDTKVKMLWDKDYFYFYAQLEEPHIWATLQQRDTVIFYDDDFEIFIDPDGDGHNYYELEINALNTLWDLILLRPYRADSEPKVLDYWNISDIQTAVHVEGTLNDPSDTDQYWAVEMAVPWSALRELAEGDRAPKDGDQWRVNFSRVDWTMDIDKGQYRKRLNEKGKALPEDNWVWSPTGFINMHMPEQWGFVQFTDAIIGEETVDFQVKKEESIKWMLWQLYFQQRSYFKAHGKYLTDLRQMTIPTVEIPDCSLDFELYTTPHLFEIIANSCDGIGKWSIRQDGKIQYFSLDRDKG